MSNTQIDKLPPHSPEAEQGVLSCMLIDPSAAIPETLAKVKDASDFFYELRHREIFDAMVSMTSMGEPVDMITLMTRLKDFGQLEQVGGLTYLNELMNAAPSAANLTYYLTILVEKYALRQVIATCAHVVASAYGNDGSVVEFMDQVEKQVMKIGHLFCDDVDVTVKELVKRAINYFEECLARQGQIAGLATGFISLDRMTSGLKPGDMVVIAGRPGLGKTSLAMNIAEHVACDQKLPVGVFSLEMTKDSLIQRMICSRGRINLRKVTEGSLNQGELTKLIGASSLIANAPLYIDDTAGLSIMQLRARARRMFQRYKVKLIVIDYLQLMNSPGGRNDNRAQEVGAISMGVKQLAKELSIPVIVLSQLNRELDKDKKERKPRLSDLRESGAIEQDADVVGMLYNLPPKDGDNPNILSVNMNIAKQRSGPTGDVEFTFFKETTRFETAARDQGEK